VSVVSHVKRDGRLHDSPGSAETCVMGGGKITLPFDSSLSLTATFLPKLSKSVSLCRSYSVSSQCRSLRHGDRVDGSNALCFRVVRPSVCACVCASGRKHSPVGLLWTSAYFFSYFMCCLFWRIKTVHGQGCSPERELGGTPETRLRQRFTVT